MSDVDLGFIAPSFESVGDYVNGGVELIATTLLIVPAIRKPGTLLGLISGAIFFHLVTPLRVNRMVNAAGDTEGGILFYMACGVGSVVY